MLELVRSRQHKPTDDRGAVSTIFAIFLGAGLFMAIIGLVVDGGQILVQKQLARNAADSVAEAVAVHCAKSLASVNCLSDNYNLVALNGATIGSATNSDFLNSVANPRGTSMA
ncbi:MAG: hypothetical protein KGL72_05940, partial [Actinomycetales bacterium]|nr:hypothetical protein [Actinomycetales bacterium]